MFHFANTETVSQRGDPLRLMPRSQCTGPCLPNTPISIHKCWSTRTWRGGAWRPRGATFTRPLSTCSMSHYVVPPPPPAPQGLRSESEEERKSIFTRVPEVEVVYLTFCHPCDLTSPAFPGHSCGPHHTSPITVPSGL